jgi:signal transduction histidine kinase
LELEVDGRVFLATVSTVYSSERQTMGRVAVLQDVTELKQLDRLKSEFVAGVSHDLLSPLTYMHNYATLLPADDAALEREYAEKILAGIDRMKQMVNDLLDLARIEAGLNLQLDRVRIGDLLDEVAQEYATPAKAHGLRLVVEAGEETAMADPALLRRAVTNLVTNALKYAPDSGLVTLRADAADGQVIISVRDQGPGIAPTDRAHLFEKFYRGEGATSDRPRGSGLGLAIVRLVADHHGGRTWCESELGVGSVFYLSLPAASAIRNSPSVQ